MEADTILRIKPELTRFLHQFDDCFGRVSTRRYLDLYGACPIDSWRLKKAWLLRAWFFGKIRQTLNMTAL